MYINSVAGSGLIFPEDEDTTTANSSPTDNTTNNTPTCQIAINSFEVLGGERTGQDWEVKSRKDAWVPVSPKLQEEMSQWDKLGEIWVLDRGSGDRHWAHLNELTASMRFVQTKCNCRGPKPLHGFRAGVATELLRQGASRVHVQRLLRHEDLSTTMIYLDANALEIENLVRNL